MNTRYGRSVIIGFQKTQIYQRFAGSRQGVFILKLYLLDTQPLPALILGAEFRSSQMFVSSCTRI